MQLHRIAVIALLATGLSAPAMAQDNVGQLDDLDANRINANQITIDFEYDGSACEEVGPAEVGDLVDGTLAVIFPTVSTAEVCTQQIVEIEVEQTIAAEDMVSRVDVSVTRPDGTVLAAGSTDVEND